MNMTIVKALKEKNRIAGRIAKLQRDVEKYNHFEGVNTNDFNSRDLLRSLQEEWAFLIDIKTKIAKANNGIADKLVNLTEAKAELSFWEGFRAGQAEETTLERRYIGGQTVEVSVLGGYTIPNKEIQENINRVQKLIEDLQDEIDNYNATTQI
jgi:hypothetical protein